LTGGILFFEVFAVSSTIAIVGRPNVGKSTLFNRLTRSKRSLVDDQPGVTRDRLYGTMQWKGTAMTIVDTGGFGDTGQEPLLDKIRDQVIKAVDEAERIIFMVDGLQGVMPGDEEIYSILRRSEKRVYLAVNKIEGPEHEHLALDFYGLGVDRLYAISAAHGYGLKTLLEKVFEESSVAAPGMEKEGQIRIAVLGRPNTGKSSLINRILGSDRLLVSEVPGTTRDSVDTLFPYKGKEYLLIDTAGLRRKGRVKEKIEKFSMIKSLASLDRCHIAVVLLDAAAGIAEQDARICGYAFDRGRGLVLAVNKWDLVKNRPEWKRQFSDALNRQLQFIAFAPRINLSALTGEHVMTLFDKIDQVFDQFSMRINTAGVNRAIEAMMQKKPPPVVGKGRLKFLYATQTGTKPPTFVVFLNKPTLVHFSYKRFMINQLREDLGLIHTPIKLIFRGK